MRKHLSRYFALFLFVLINTLFASDSDTTGVTFPIHIDWLQERYAPMGLYQPTRISFPTRDKYVGKVNLQGVRDETYVDSTGNYIYFRRKLDNTDLYLPAAIDINEYYERKKYTNLRENFRQMAIENTQEQKTTSSRSLELIGAEIAGQKVALRVSGNINISGQMNNRQRSMVATNIRDGKSSDFKIDQKMRFNIEGTIGDRVSILVDQDSERSFDFENNMRIIYTGKEDEIVQKVSAGNISLSLPGTRYVTFSSKNSGLFGLKADMKFGPVNVTTIASVEKGEKQKLSYDGGAKKTELDIPEYKYVRDRYFYLDYSFRERHWDGFLENLALTYNDDIVRDLELYKSVPQETASSVYGTAYVDPNNPEEYDDFKKNGYYERMVEGVDYQYSADFGYIKFMRVPRNVNIAAVYTVRHRETDEILRQFGDWDRDPTDTTATDINLKLIKSNTMTDGNHPCWDLMWRNVYDLQASNIDSTGFDIQILYDGKSGYEERSKEDGDTYLKKFDLDIVDASGNFGQDDMVDLNTGVVRLTTGELVFPRLKPFKYDPSEEGEGNPNIEGYSTETMYNKDMQTSQSDIVGETKFIIRVKYENRSSVIQLPPMLMEGSEEITLNGRRLSKGSDYDIDYMSGTLTMYDENATKPDAKLDIKYEKNSFFQLKRKTILGARAQYDFGPDKKNFIGATGLYYSKSVVDDKVEVGYEPMANFVFDINGRYGRDLKFLTKALDRLPLIDTDAKSSFTVEGEVARVLPNPNTSNNKSTGDRNGVAYVDDFEGSKRTIAPVLTKRFWSRSAPPVEKEAFTNREIAQNDLMGHAFWYVDYDGILMTEIWPEKDLGRTGRDRRTSPLYLALEPEAAPAVGVNATDEQKKQAWGGITYHFPTSSRDQEKTKFVDIWLKGDIGDLHVDLGQISEDQIPDSKLNTEDVYGDFRNDRYDEGEDVGLDGVEDEEEKLYVRDYNASVYDTLSYNDPELDNYLRPRKDPHLDNFNYTAGTLELEKLRTVNGTENNKEDGAANGRPDTENRNDNPAIDVGNNYRSITIPLDDFEYKYFEDETEKDGEKTGYKLYRIPLVAFENVNGFNDESFSWQYIEAMRLWLDGVTDLTQVEIVKIEMVRNEWEAQGIADGYFYDDIFLVPDTNNYVANDKTFGTTVKNNHENEDYRSPDGVKGEVDKVNEVEQKEQSLVLKLYDQEGAIGLGPNQMVVAEKEILNTKGLSLINYKRLKMFVNGYNINDGESYIDGEKTPLNYFIRFGKGGNSPQFFEIRKPVYGGWDDKNHLNVDLDFLTSLKKYNSEEDYRTLNNKSDEDLQEFWIRDDETYDVIRVYKEVKDEKYTGKEFIVYGTPSVSRIKRMEMGLINTGNYPVYGEVWFNELRVSEVRKNSGTAARASFALKLADFADINMNVSSRDADFHRVEEQPSNQASALSDKKQYNTSARINVDKLFPSKWGVKLPVSTTMSYSENRPKYIPGTDILTGDNPADSISSLNQSYGFNTSISKRSSDFWLTKYTIDQLRLNFSMKKSENSNKDVKSQESEQYNTGLSYSIPFGRDNFWQIFKWAENIPVIGKSYAETKFYYTPDKFSYKISGSERKNLKIPRGLGDTTSTHVMRMKQNFDFGYKVTDNIKLGYSRNMNNNLDHIADDKWSNFQRFKFGYNESVNEKFNLSFSPQFLAWFSPQLNYSSAYKWSEPATSTTDYLDQLGNSNNMSVSGKLDIADIFKSFYTDDGTKSSSRSGSRRGSRRSSRSRRSRRSSRSEPDEEKKESKDHPILDGIHKYLDKLDAIQVSYSIQNNVNNQYREPKHATLNYRLGFSQNPGLDTLMSGSGINNVSTTNSLSLRSGLNIIKNIKTSLSYSYKNNSSVRQEITKETVSEDYFPMGDGGDEGFPFPNWQVRISGLEKIPLADKIFKSLSASHSFTGKRSETFKDGELQTSSYRMGFSPLISLSMRFKKDINSNFRISNTKSIRTNNGGIDRDFNTSYSFDLNYKHSGGITLPIPFMENKRFDNNIDFTMTFEYSTSRTEVKQVDMDKFSEKESRSNLSIKPRIGYSFTQKVTGGVFLQYQIIDDVRLGERKNLNYGFDVNIAIRG